MNQIIFFLLLPMFFYSEPPDCKDLHEGYFTLYDNSGDIHTIIVRQKKRQVEYLVQSEMVYEFEIKWQTPCSYYLFNPRAIMGHPDFLNESKGDTLFTKIVEVSHMKHKTISSLNGFEVEFTLEKVDSTILNHPGIHLSDFTKARRMLK